MNFNKDIIVSRKLMGGKKILFDVRNMKYVAKSKRFGSSV